MTPPNHGCVDGVAKSVTRTLHSSDWTYANTLPAISSPCAAWPGLVGE
ncbi:hypothetical protein AB0O28_21360 [Microbispora sp. NPDC088329]